MKRRGDSGRTTEEGGDRNHSSCCLLLKKKGGTGRQMGCGYDEFKAGCNEANGMGWVKKLKPHMTHP
ncbi:hypothetical protein M0R45_035052 [Rubus argutus]|uniref:Uncharacterized protein n=1 Tax=Rubus argutus TaxID=59490 RepID=A0AAW1VUG8_RUBAR